MKNLDSYFDKCIKDAYNAEGRDYDDKTTYFYIVVGNQLLYSIDSPYARVCRRVILRIDSNAQKNFGLTTDGQYFLDKMLQPNYVCNHFKVGNKDMYLCDSKFPLNKGAQVFEDDYKVGSLRYVKLVLAYHNITPKEYREAEYTDPERMHLPSDISWEKYRKTFLKAYGVYPEVPIKCASTNVILDFENKGDKGMITIGERISSLEKFFNVVKPEDVSVDEWLDTLENMETGYKKKTGKNIFI